MRSVRSVLSVFDMLVVLLLGVFALGVSGRSRMQTPEDLFDLMCWRVNENLPKEWQFQHKDPRTVDFFGYEVFSVGYAYDLTAFKPTRFQRKGSVNVDQIGNYTKLYSGSVDLETVKIVESLILVKLTVFKFTLTIGVDLLESKSEVQLIVNEIPPDSCRADVTAHISSKIHFFTSNSILTWPVLLFLDIVDRVPLFHDLFENLLLPDIPLKLIEAIKPVAQTIYCS